MGDKAKKESLWTYYWDKRNAVVYDDMRACIQYLDRHFAGASGDIWIYHTDLKAFIDCDDFAELYLQTIDRHESKIRRVRLVLEQRTIDETESDDWARITSHLGLLGDKLRKSIRYATKEHIISSHFGGVEPLGFKRFTSDESFIFYTRNRDITVCVQRLFVPKGQDIANLRLTIVACHGEGGEKGPLHTFLDAGGMRGHFESIFNEQKTKKGEYHIEWSNFYPLAKERGIEGAEHLTTSEECTALDTRDGNEDERLQEIHHHHWGDEVNGVQYKGQIGAAGPGATNVANQQIWNHFENTPDSAKLAEELSQLRAAMKKEATSSAQDSAVGALADAEQAALVNDGSAVIQHLKRAGQWAFEVATQIGVRVAAAAIEAAIGAP